MLAKLLPRHMDLIYLVNFYWIEKLKAFYPDKPEKLESLSLIEEGDIDLDSPIIISCSIDNNSFPMTMLIKCSESCPSAHITFHVSNEIIMN